MDMYVFNIDEPEKPYQEARVSHFYSCDPVVADDNYAFVTLRDGVSCRWTEANELQVINGNFILINKSYCQFFCCVSFQGDIGNGTGSVCR